jgi:hypothetical protein
VREIDVRAHQGIGLLCDACPLADKVAPHITSFAKGELYLWWSPAWPKNRRPSPNRRVVVLTLLTLAVRMRSEVQAQAAASAEPVMPFMSSDVWLRVLSFVRHDLHML